MSTQRIIKKKRGKLTSDYNILTNFLVMLASAANPARETLTLVLELLTPLTHRDMCHQLILNTKDQQAADTRRKRKTHSDENLPTLSRGTSPHPQPLVKGVLHIICLAHLGDELARRGEFGTGGPDLGFTLARNWRLR